MNKYWVLVASKNHVLIGIKEGFAQACHGKAMPLKKMSHGDGIIYYSPKMEFGRNLSCQEFTAIGFVSDDIIYAHDMGRGFVPHRRNIRYINAKPIEIRPLIDKLNFISDKKSWGYRFRFGAFEISKADFELIATEMNAVTNC